MKKVIAVLVIILILIVGVFFYIGMDKEEELVIENATVEAYFNQKEIWENKDLMPRDGIAGFYKTGYSFFDIDFDGEKELAVQLGGGTLLNCKTNFYECESGEIKLTEFFEEGYSVSVNELRKFTQSGEIFYINKYRLKIEPTKYITYYDRLSSGATGVDVVNLLAREEIFSENGEATFNYLVDGNYVDKTTYYDAYDRRIKYLEQEMMVVDFIPYEDWKKMSDEEKINQFERSYSNENLEYAIDIKNNIIMKEVLEENLVIENDVVITKEIFGEKIEDYKKIAGVEEVLAQVVTDKNTFVAIIPNSELIDSQVYYYKDGRKVAYTKEFVSNGKVLEYYLKDGEVVCINTNGLEEDMLINPEEDIDISLRANKIYSKYMK